MAWTISNHRPNRGGRDGAGPDAQLRPGHPGLSNDRIGTRVMVAGSGGKDSYTLLDLLERLAPLAGALRFHRLQRRPGIERVFRCSDVISRYHLKAAGHRYHIEVTEIAHTHPQKDGSGGRPLLDVRAAAPRRAVPPGHAAGLQQDCPRAPRRRRHRDAVDAAAFNGQIQTMPPVRRAENGLHTVIRPMVYVWEREVILSYVRAPCASRWCAAAVPPAAHHAAAAPDQGLSRPAWNPTPTPD